MIAVITKDRFQYERYCEIKKLKNLKDTKQVSIMSDIKNEKFTDLVLIEGSLDVTDYVVKKVKESIDGKKTKK